ncbi:MAG: hypothetical protein M0C28_32905 [Candidatus Moduliflexus flocculans]|nr:hypothetical protein [Candidatus Moduliflexus flocculans]
MKKRDVPCSGADGAAGCVPGLGAGWRRLPGRGHPDSDPGWRGRDRDPSRR